MLFCVSQTRATSAIVSTDQIDYQPDTTATIDGSGFQPGETVELQVLNLTTPSDTGAEHDPWTTNADVNGDFETTWYVTLDETNQTLELTATGLTSGLVAQRVFTDSATVTPANVSISADTAANAVAPAWTTLGNIKVAENNKADFSAGTGLTLILKAPAGWQFNTAATPTTTFSGPEITAASTAVSDSSTLTVTVTVTDNAKFQDIFTISGVQIRPATGRPLSTGLQIYRPTTGGGTLIINGVTTSTNGSSGTSFGGLTETNGVLAGYVISGTSSTTAGTSQNLTIQKVDQFGNSLNNSNTVTLTFSGLGSVGSNNPKINGATTAFSSGVSVAFNSSGLATTTLSLIPYKAEAATLNVTDGTKTSAAVSGGLALTVSATTANKLAFTTSAVSVTVGVASGNITVQRQDQFGNPVTAEGTRTVTLSSSSTGTVSFIPASLSIASGSSSANFTYTDTKSGTPTVTAVSTSPGTITSATQLETVTKATPAISGVTASQGISYGTTTVSLNGNVSANGSIYPTNGETVSVTINSITTNATVSGGSGGFSVNFSTANIPFSASAYTITYAYAGDANLNAAPNNTSTALTVNKAALGITANNDTKTYGQSKTYGTGSTAFTSSSLKNGETIGTMTITASGGTATNATVGTYSLTPSAATGGTFNPANYNITYTNGNLTVNKAGTSVVLASSANPSGFNGNVIFTASVTPSAATGTMTFQTNGTALGSPITLVNGAATNNTASLPRGTTPIKAIYSGDTNYLPSTNTLSQVVTNHPPAAGPGFTMSVVLGTNSVVQIVGGKYPPTDADGDLLTIIGVTGATNGTVTFTTTNITYTGTNGTADSFTYTVGDGNGGTASQTVNVVSTPPNQPTLNLVSVTFNTAPGATDAMLRFAGLPQSTYTIQYTGSLTPPIIWTALGSAIVTNGVFQIVDPTAGSAGQRYYRTSYQSP